MMKIGCMVWRIGDILPFFDQVRWIRDHGFEEISFHTRPGDPGKWEGFDPAAPPDRVALLKDELAPFEDVDLHAPFGIPDLALASPDAGKRELALARLVPTFELGRAVGAKVVTVHVEGPPSSGGEGRANLAESLKLLDRLAEKHRVRVGVETEEYCDLPAELGLQNIGLTVDVGHFSMGGGKKYERYGSLGGVIRTFREKIFHVHVHDYDGEHDHIAIGRGHIDFDDVCGALKEINYSGSLCLEINPDREPPEDIIRSRDALRAILE